MFLREHKLNFNINLGDVILGYINKENCPVVIYILYAQPIEECMLKCPPVEECMLKFPPME